MDTITSLTSLCDTILNGRPARQRKGPEITLADLIERESGHVKVGRKIYRFEVKDVTDKVTKIA